MTHREITQGLSHTDTIEVHNNFEDYKKTGVLGDCLLRKLAELHSEPSEVSLTMMFLGYTVDSLLAEKHIKQLKA